MADDAPASVDDTAIDGESGAFSELQPRTNRDKRAQGPDRVDLCPSARQLNLLVTDGPTTIRPSPRLSADDGPVVFAITRSAPDFVPSGHLT